MLAPLVPLLAAAALAAGAAASPRTLRVDLYHHGDGASERFALDRVVREPLPFPGRPDRPIDDTGLGKYAFEVRDVATQRVLYSRGFASIFGEWEATPEAKVIPRAFSESLRFPEPAGPVQVVVRKRGQDGAFREAFAVVIDPADRTVDDARPPSPGPVIALQDRGDPAFKLDLLLVGDGYTAAERPKFEADARRLVEALFQREPFRSRRDDFNVWGLVPPADEPGISRPLTGKHRRTRVGATYDAFGSERYVLSFENRSLRDVASFAPYDALAIVVNSETYGGGGIFNLYTTVAAGSRFAEYIFVHELGHSLGALADEYFTSDPVFSPSTERPEPWEPNVTADPRGGKWKALLTPGVPLPTPWPKEAFTKRARALQEQRKRIRAENRPEAEMDALFLQQKKEETALLSRPPHAGKVGAFEGANYEATGYYRPQVDCVMFTRDDVPFCAVCQQALGRVIDLYAGRPAGP
jgi:IgA Peptidase M64/Peptidase M64 N-terminus